MNNANRNFGSSHQGQNIWQSGLDQNVIFLAELFQRLPIVQSALLIGVGDQGAMPPQVDLASRNIRLLSAHGATDEVDVIIEMVGALDVQWLDLMRARQEGGLLPLWSAIRRSRGARCLQQAGPRGAARPLRRNLTLPNFYRLYESINGRCTKLRPNLNEAH